jgi:putative transposase
MRRFKSPGHAQRFLESFGPIYEHFAPKRHLLGAAAFRQELARRHATWREIAGIAA